MDMFFNKIDIIRNGAFSSMSTSNAFSTGNTCLGTKKINLPNIISIEDLAFASCILPGGIELGCENNEGLNCALWTTGDAGITDWTGIFNSSSQNGGPRAKNRIAINLIYNSHEDMSQDDFIRGILMMKGSPSEEKLNIETHYY